ncbi:MAG TPA: sigma-70 family RNA polymerase sigma factor, partial [Pyrinomonadaceae bacterium]
MASAHESEKGGQHADGVLSGAHRNLGEVVVRNRRRGGRREGATAFRFERKPEQGHPAASEEVTDDEERRLLASLAAGETQVFWLLWERYRGYLFGVCIRQNGGAREEAEEALSKAMMRALERLPPQAGEITNLKYWLARLTHNICIDIHRERQRRRAMVAPLDEVRAEVTGMKARQVETPEQAVLRREKHVYMERVIRALPSRLRNPFLLRFLRLMSYHAIAENLEITAESARKRVQHARVRLREQMGGYFAEGGPPALPPDDDDDATRPGRPRPVAGLRTEKRDAAAAGRTAGRPVQVMLPSGAEMSFYVALDGGLANSRARVETLEKYVREHPRGWRKRLALARLLYAAGRWEDAVREYRLVAQRQGRAPEARMQAGVILRLMGRRAEAHAFYDGALPLARSSASRHHIRGQMEVCGRCYGSAAAEFAKAAMLEPGNVEHWNALGLVSLCEDSRELALHAFARALELQSDDVVALTYSYEPLVAAGNLPEARRLAERALSLNPDDALALARLADLRTASGMVQGAEGRETRRLIRSAVRLAPRATFGCASLVLYRLARDEFEEAVALASAFVERNPVQPCGWYYYAYALWRAGKREAAAGAVVTAAALCRGEYALECDAAQSVGGPWVWEGVEACFASMLRHFPESRCLWLKPLDALA